MALSFIYLKIWFGNIRWLEQESVTMERQASCRIGVDSIRLVQRFRQRSRQRPP